MSQSCVFLSAKQFHEEDDQKIKHKDVQIDSSMSHTVTWFNPIRTLILRNGIKNLLVHCNASMFSIKISKMLEILHAQNFDF